jgi:threonine dehydrogenase-like Zn-dependent dehydrogenase
MCISKLTASIRLPIKRNVMATMSGVVLPGDSTVKHAKVDVPEPDRIVTHRYSLDQADEAYRVADQGAPGEVCIVFD